MSEAITKIGLIAGGGALPHHVISGAEAAGHAVYVAAIAGFAEPESFPVDAASFGIAAFGKIVKAFKRAGCSHVCFAGYIKRPNFMTLKPDWKGLSRLPGAIKAAQDGDNALLEYILGVFEGEGFTVIAPQALCAHLLLPEGHLGAVKMQADQKADALKACETASAMGALDIGQGAIVCRGLVLAVEAQEGTDAMLTRMLALPSDIRGTPEARAGVLAKMVKPGQERRVDLPTLGVETVRLAAEAGLAGIVAEGGGAFVIDKAEVILMADEAGIFIAGLPKIQLKPEAVSDADPAHKPAPKSTP